MYTVSETAGSVELRYRILDPTNLTLFDGALFLTVDVVVTDDTAEGNAVDLHTKHPYSRGGGSNFCLVRWA